MCISCWLRNVGVTLPGRLIQWAQKNKSIPLLLCIGMVTEVGVFDAKDSLVIL